MEPFHRTAVLLWTLLLLVIVAVHAQKDPEHTVTHFQNLPTRLFFFEDRTVWCTASCVCASETHNFHQEVIYHDSTEGNVYFSQNEGKSWSRVADIPSGKAAMVIEHPFDNTLVSATLVLRRNIYFDRS